MNENPSPIILEIIKLARENKLARNADVILKAIKEDERNINFIFKLGITFAQNSRLSEALFIFSCLLSHIKTDARIPYNLGLIHSLRGEYQLALEAYDLALNIKPDDVEALINKGAACNDIKNHVLAIEVLDDAIGLNSNIPEAWSNKGIALNNLNRYQESVDAYDMAIALNPCFHEAWSNKSIPLNRLQRFAEASAACDEALSLKPDYAEGCYNKANTLYELKRYDEAITYYDKALSLKSDYAEAYSSKGAIFYELKRYDEAITYYDKALSLKPEHAETWSNKGNALSELKSYDQAIVHYDKALSLKQDYAEAHSNKGTTLHDLRRYDEAIAQYDKALSIRPDYAEGWSNKGNALSELKSYEAAIAHFDKALTLKPSIDWVHGYLLHMKMKICDWSDFTNDVKNITNKLALNEKVIHQFQLLSLADSTSLHKKCSEIYAGDRYPASSVLGPIPKLLKHSKIRIGYFSADFNEHAVAILAAELFELHDKNRFEIICFSFGVNDKGPMRLRLSQACNRFIDVTSMSDKAIATLARDVGIDIAVDLGGFTANSRTGIFAYRAAPIQVSYVGYLGTMGVNYIDYLLGDSTIVPVGSEKFYSEKIAHLPSYQVNDRKRVISDKKFTKQELGLPEKGFVFCCFNNNYKILPVTFDGWMRILKAVEGSILFLYADNPSVEANLRREAEARGIDSGRLVFGERIPGDEYLARYRACDLFLDTTPYNAGVTASDALWVGLPLLTLAGESFASRMAASLLNAIGIPELITTNQQDYEDLAIGLAKNPKKLAAIKQKLVENRLTTPLFDAPSFTKNIENAYVKMHERYQANLPADHLYI